DWYQATYGWQGLQLYLLSLEHAVITSDDPRFGTSYAVACGSIGMLLTQSFGTPHWWGRSRSRLPEPCRPARSDAGTTPGRGWRGLRSPRQRRRTVHSPRHRQPDREVAGPRLPPWMP